MKTNIEKTSPDEVKLKNFIENLSGLSRDRTLLLEIQKIDMLFQLASDQRRKTREVMQNKQGSVS